RATRKRPFVWRCVTFNARVAMVMAGRASLPWRGIRRFDSDLFIISMAMLGGGLYLVVADFYWATAHIRKIGLGGAASAGLGGYLLWIDFLAPMLGIKAE